MFSKKILISIVSSVVLLALTFFVIGSHAQDPREVIRLATTTSVENSGLLDHLLEIYQEQENVQVDYIAVGSGQAIGLGQRGDVDLILSHAPELEIEFIESGYGLARLPVMRNDFVILGPIDDPADVRSASIASEAFKRIMASQSTFISRGDNSGTHLRERMIWQESANMPTSSLPWYISSGQGMGASLLMANELGGYILSDRSTYSFQAEQLSNLAILLGGENALENKDPQMMNLYSLIAVNPQWNEGINHAGAAALIEWMTAVPTQYEILKYGQKEFGSPLFLPNSENWNMSIQNGSVDIPELESPSTFSGESKPAASLTDTNVREILLIVGRTLQVSGSSLVLACLIGIPIGTAIGMLDFRFKRHLQILIYTGMGLPPVVVGLAAYLMLSNQGYLGELNWLFTVNGMILAQTVLAFPLASGLTISAVEAVPEELLLQVRSLGASPWQERKAVLHQARRGLMAAVLAALGRIISEVGAVMLVGGNIAGQTRVLSTAIVLETRQGSFGFALALGSILLGIALFSNAIVIWLGGRWPK